MKNHHAFDLSILGLAVITAFVVACLPMILSRCSLSGGSSSPRVAVAVSADTLTAATGTRIPLHIYVVNESGVGVEGGSVQLALSDVKSGKLVRTFDIKGVQPLAPKAVSTTTAFWSIPAALPQGVYSMKGSYVLGGMALSGSYVSTGSPFGNSARLFISSDAKGTIATAPTSSLAPAAAYVMACPGSKGIYDWAALIGGLGVAMLLLIRRSRKN